MTADERQAFWSANQPGIRFTSAPPGTSEFFEAVERHRYALEPATAEMASFPRWRGRDVLEVGCGIGTDGACFARHGARYTGVDLSETAIELSKARFALQALDGRFERASATELPFAEESFDLLYSCGVIHHIHETQRAIAEFHRVLRPGGRAVVMVYHRGSFNFHVTIMGLRRALAALLVIPGAVNVVARAAGERPEVLEGHRALISQQGLRYLRDRQLFLSNNTDGPGNPLSKVYTPAEMRAIFLAAGFQAVSTAARYLNLRTYPGGQRFSRTRVGRRLERRYGWHLWIHATKTQSAAARGAPARP